jgi:pilus assembly protein CpaC
MRTNRSNLALALALALAPAAASAAPQVAGAPAQSKQSIAMQVGETQLVVLTEKIIRISVADPSVADVQAVTPKQVLITGKGVGSTQIVMWGESDQPLVLAIDCNRNLDQLRAQFRSLFPEEKISVGSVGELVVLSGKVSDLRTPARAAQVAQLYSSQLANLIEVIGDQQVELEVRFAEVSRSALREMGLNFLWRDASRGHVAGMAAAGTAAGQYISGANNLIVPGTASASGPPLVSAPAFGNGFNLFFSTGLSQFPFSAILSVLSDEGLAKILAEPTLVALSGQEAKFHAGGEIPILIARELGTTSVEFKKFGVQLDFTPTVLGEGTISLDMSVEVSEPDPTSGVVLGGFTIPGFKTRSSATTVRLQNGQSFAVAGLLSETMRSAVAKVPLFGDIPILGALFRSTQYQRQETELMVVVKAHLVRPQRPDQLPPLPGEGEFTDPNDFQLFLMGSLAGPAETRPGPASAPAQGGPSGPIGFVRNTEP